MLTDESLKLTGLTMGIFKDVRPSDVDGKWDISVLTNVDEECGQKRSLYSLSRIRRLDFKE